MPTRSSATPPITTPPPTTQRVVILGAGYAGIIATNRFLGSLTDEERDRVEVTVVNPRPDFVERIRLHELAAGSRHDVRIPLARLLHPQAAVLVGSATRIDSRAHTVRVHTDVGEQELSYDLLGYAVGSHAAAAIPGARAHAFLIADLDDAEVAAEELQRLGPGSTVLVVGGGLTAIETASEVAAQHPQVEVTLLCAEELAAGMRPAARRSIARALRRLGVQVVHNSAVTEVTRGMVVLEGGGERAFDVCLVAASFEVPALAENSALAVDAAGRLQVDAALRSLSDPAIIGAGDAIVAPAAVAGHVRMGCAAALPLGGHAAETLLAALRRREPAPFSMGYVVQCVSLGRKTGYIQLVHADDTPRRLHVAGHLGARIKEKVCRLVVDGPRKESTRPGAYSWPRGPRSPRPAAARHDQLEPVVVASSRRAGGR